MSFSRLDIVYAVGRLSKYTQCQNQEHWSELYMLMRYLRGSMDYVIEYSGFPAILEGYSDANWIFDSDETKSTGGYVLCIHISGWCDYMEISQRNNYSTFKQTSDGNPTFVIGDPMNKFCDPRIHFEKFLLYPGRLAQYTTDKSLRTVIYTPQEVAVQDFFDYDSSAPPEQAWRRRLNSHANLLKEFRKAPIDPFTRESCKPSASQGVPLGGMGSGSISRGFRGEFRQWQIIPSLCEASPVMANQFSGISSWGWNLSGQHSTYHALFPRAWTVYDGEPDPELKISCRQISPFIPHNYRESSLPAAVFVYTERKELKSAFYLLGRDRAIDKITIDINLLQNSIGGSSHLSGNHVNEPFRQAVPIYRTAKGNPPVTFSIAACETQNVSVSVLPSFGLSEGSSVTAKDMWSKMVKENFNSGPSMSSSLGETLCAAVAATAWVEPHGKCTVAFSLAWSSPKVKFVKGCTFNRRYTKFYGTSEKAAVDLAHDALTSMLYGLIIDILQAYYSRWEEEIEKWQNPILKDETLPEW
ncbi:hypothetical protein V8G54_028166 [Vigna mungo]|uniref:Glycosyl-hydrolase family 116 N-terminal domain-containing protein n=1 Tax=Vigna mungo TaxID=3915 RepID=A0AAQ3MS56_VIGMU